MLSRDAVLKTLGSRSQQASRLVVADDDGAADLAYLVTDIILTVLSACRQRQPDEAVAEMARRAKDLGPLESLAVRQACRAQGIFGRRAEQVLQAVRSVAAASAPAEIVDTIRTVERESLYELL